MVREGKYQREMRSGVSMKEVTDIHMGRCAGSTPVKEAAACHIPDRERERENKTNARASP